VRSAKLRLVCDRLSAISIYTGRRKGGSRSCIEEKIRLVFRVIGKLTQSKEALVIRNFCTLNSPSVLYSVIFAREASFFIFMFC
jgi:hypothetical protein